MTLPAAPTPIVGFSRLRFIRATRAVAVFPKHRDGLQRVDAVPPAAIGNDLAALGKLTQTALQLCDRYGERAGDMSGGELFGRSDVDHRDVAVAHHASQIGERHPFQPVVTVEVELYDALDLREPAVPNGFEGAKEPHDIIISESVVHIRTVSARVDELRLPQDAQVGARVLEWRRDVLGQPLDALFALAQQAEQLDALGTRERVSDSCELGVQCVFELAVGRHRSGDMEGLTRCSNDP